MSQESLAERLEALFPSLLRALYRPKEGDPLSELTIGQIRIVRLLYAETHTVSSLGEELGMSISATTQMTQRLEGSGLVEKSDDPLDKRVKILRLSLLGKRLMDVRRAQRIDHVQRVLDGMSKDRQMQLIDVLDELRGECLRVCSGDGGSKRVIIGELEQALPLHSPKQREVGI